MPDGQLINCETCRAQISTNASVCPACGEVGPAEVKLRAHRRRRIQNLLLIASLLIVCIGIAFVAKFLVERKQAATDAALRDEIRELYPILEECYRDELPSLRSVLRNTGDDLLKEATATRELAADCVEAQEESEAREELARQQEEERIGQLRAELNSLNDRLRTCAPTSVVIAPFGDSTNEEWQTRLSLARDRVGECGTDEEVLERLREELRSLWTVAESCDLQPNGVAPELITSIRDARPAIGDINRLTRPCRDRQAAIGRLEEQIQRLERCPGRAARRTARNAQAAIENEEFSLTEINETIAVLGGQVADCIK